MKDMVKTYFTVAWIASIVVGVLYSITIFGLILGIPLFMGAPKFKNASNMSDSDLVKNRSNLFGWGIFLAIVLAPSILGLVIALIFVIMVNNYILDLEKGNTQATEKSFGETVKDGVKNILSDVKEGVTTSLEDQLAELEELKESGKITEEEYTAKRKQILNVKD